MDARARQSTDPPARRRFTNADVIRMLEAGVIRDDEHFELLRGEIVPMSPEMDRHAYARNFGLRPFIQALDERFFVATEASLFLFDDTEVKPDLHVFPAHLLSDKVRGPDVLLAVEIASTSRHRDFAIKLPLYAEAGVAELWIFDLDEKRTHVFRDPEGQAYRSHHQHGPDEEVRPRAFPHIAVRLSDLLRNPDAG
jgi:Uma2 family endonuclease